MIEHEMTDLPDTLDELEQQTTPCPVGPAPGYAVIVREEVPEMAGSFHLARTRDEAVRDLMCTARLVYVTPSEDPDAPKDPWIGSLDADQRVMAMIPGSGLEYEVGGTRYNVVPVGCIVARIDDDTPQIEVVMRYMQAAQEAGGRQM